MVGWDFESLRDKLVEDEPPWDFEADSSAALASCNRAVDLGTGGGERLTKLLETSESNATIVATEGWEPNVSVARANLAPQGIDVYPYHADRDSRLPLESGSQDLVMARHEAVDASEIARVLVPGGRFLTQQVEVGDTEEILDWFGVQPTKAESLRTRYTNELEAAGLLIDVAEEWSGALVFLDAEALVTYLGFIPWYVPGFTVDDHLERLLELETQGPIRVTKRRSRIYATKR